MSYIKFESRALGDDRWMVLSPSAFVVHTWALDHCNEQATDGWVSDARSLRLNCPVSPGPDMAAAWDELVADGLWVVEAGGFFCPTFTSYGFPAKEQDAYRKKWAGDKRRRRLCAIGNHEICGARSKCRAAMSTGGQTPTAEWTSGRPDLTGPDPTPQGSGSGPALDHHQFVNDGSGASCLTCALPERSPRHGN